MRVEILIFSLSFFCADHSAVCCVTSFTQQVFPSRNILFKHLKESGHGANLDYDDDNDNDDDNDDDNDNEAQASKTTEVEQKMARMELKVRQAEEKAALAAKGEMMAKKERDAAIKGSSYEISLSEIDVASAEQVAVSSFKTVYHGKWRGNDAAILEVRQGGVASELHVLASLSNHPNLTQLFGNATDPSTGKDYLIMEWMPCGSLSDVIDPDNGEISEHVRLSIARQVCEGMRCLEESGIIHRDLAARNILVASVEPTVRVKVTDFGLAKQSGIYYGSGGPFPTRWVPPEVFRKGKFSHKSDVWAFGVLLWEIWTEGDVPYGFGTADEVIQRKVLGGETLPRPDNCSDGIYSIMQNCWEKTASQRPTFSALSLQLADLVARPANKECIICMDKPRGARLGCGHSTTCTGCANDLQLRGDLCPVCRADITVILGAHANEQTFQSV